MQYIMNWHDRSMWKERSSAFVISLISSTFLNNKNLEQETIQRINSEKITVLSLLCSHLSVQNLTDQLLPRYKFIFCAQGVFLPLQNWSFIQSVLNWFASLHIRHSYTFRRRGECNPGVVLGFSVKVVKSRECIIVSRPLIL